MKHAKQGATSELRDFNADPRMILLSGLSVILGQQVVDRSSRTPSHECATEGVVPRPRLRRSDGVADRTLSQCGEYDLV